MTASNLKITANSKKYCVISVPFGCLGVETEFIDGSLMISRVDYLPPDTVIVRPSNDLANLFAMQCEQYFQNPAFEFDLPVKPAGTLHQKKVWNAVKDIQVGNTQTYGELAKKIQSGPRAVGTACGANPYPLITPCHRVISAQGIGGFMKENNPGFYRQVKLWLLKHEGAL